MNEHPIYKLPKWKIYGPYQRKDLRKHIIAYDGSRRITISNPKYMMECHLSRELKNDEEVHHKNNLEFDDRIENFEIINSTLHRKNHRTKEAEFFDCQCRTKFKLEGTKLSRMKSERKRFPTMLGPFCSRRCAGLYGSNE